MRYAWALVIVAGCGRSGSDAPKESSKDAARAIAPSADAPRAGEVPADAAAPSFEGVAETIATRSARKLVASGASNLAEDGQPRRWAVFEPEDEIAGRGGYLLEAAPGRLWLITYYNDGRTMAWQGKPEDLAIEHAQGHHHGGETVVFALRGGEPVVLSYEYVDDAADQDAKPVHQEFAKDGTCAAGCPSLRTFEVHDSDLQVVGPAAGLDELLAGAK